MVLLGSVAAREKLSFLKQSRVALALLLLFVAILTRLPGFNESLWYDEVWYSLFNLDGEGLRRVVSNNQHPPLYPVMMRGWMEIFGDSEIAVRLPSLLLGLASLGVLFALTRAWFGRGTAFLATLLMALSPVHIWHSQENKNNMLLLFATLLTVYGLQRAWAHNRRRDWILFVVSAIPALWTSHFALWVVSACFLWLWLEVIRHPGHLPLARIAGSTVVVGLGCLPVLWILLHNDGPGPIPYLRPFTPAEVYKLLLIYLSHGNTLRTLSPYAPLSGILKQHWGFFLIDGLFALLLGAGLFFAARQWIRHWKAAGNRSVPDPAGTGLLLSYFLVPPVALLAASLLYSTVYIERAMIILLPPFLILLSHGVMSLPRPRWRTVAVIALLAAHVVSLANLWVVKRDAWTVYKPNPDWRSFVRDLKEDGERTVVITSCETLGLDYYLEGSGSIAVPLRTNRDVDPRVVANDVHRLFKRLGLRYPRVFYVVINRHWGAHRGSALNEEVFRKAYPLLENKQYLCLDVYKYGFHR
jgi:4-amino-4-deoxy-L-arabinose transferase-like glycosyltransferase